jgi:hypothetical protein
MFKNIEIWLPGYLNGVLCKKKSIPKIARHVMFCFVDHFEPRWNKAGLDQELERTDKWLKGYLPLVSKHRDSDGIPPKYTFFYPIDELTPQVLGKIAGFCKQGYGEVEVHLHHDNDTEQGLKEKLEYAKKTFSQYGLLSFDKITKNLKFGFIHGNWALGNSREDGRWCGVNNELKILGEAGCYADFTLPSAPSNTQTSKINSIYYATGTSKPKSHNTGVDIEVGKRPSGDLMIIQGPLTLNWNKRKFGIFPKIENGGITLNNPPTEKRIDLWVNQNICVQGKPEWIFIKVYTHGTQDENLKQEYFNNLHRMFSYLEQKYNDGLNYLLHYVTAREMYNIIKAAEAGEKGEPGEYRDYLITK